MKITLITVSFNSASTIMDTIASVAKQKVKPFEYIIVDGGSTDGTKEIVNGFSDVVTKFISEPDKGIYDGMNKGIQLAEGDVIGFLNSDDVFYDTQALKYITEVFSRNPSLDSIYGDVQYVSKNDLGKVVRNWTSGQQGSFSFGWHPAHPTFYVKKKVYEKYGGFDLDFKIAADFELMLRFLSKEKISTHYLRKPMVKMRLGGESNKSLKNILFQNRECIRAFRINKVQVFSLLYPFFRIIPKLSQFFH